ncbi:MAG TPA: PAS domain S-box protein, partial [Gemmatimonadaceae bacterium]|nr:PAS domain S-box protein [Gemmatimonadaceae bacterium]
MLLVLGIAWHVTELRSTTSAATQRRFTSVASTSARMVEAWMAERDGDALALAEVAGIHGTDSTRLSPAVAGRIIRLEMESLLRRGGYLGVWITDGHGHPLGSVGGQALSPAEDSAIARAMSTQRRVVSEPEQRENAVTVAIVKPIVVDSGARTHAEAVVVFRSDLSRAFTQGVTASARTATTLVPVMVIPVDTGFIGLSLCPAPSTAVCIVTPVDTLVRRARAAPVSFATVQTPARQRVIVATHTIQGLPWSVYLAGDEVEQFAALRERLRFEAFLLLGVLVLGSLGAYAYDRSAHARHLTERAQTEARFAAIVNTAMDAIVIVNEEYAITVVNSAAELMFGYPTRDAIGVSFLELIPLASADEIGRALNQTLLGSGQPRLLSADRYAAGRRRDGS